MSSLLPNVHRNSFEILGNTQHYTMRLTFFHSENLKNLECLYNLDKKEFKWKNNLMYCPSRTRIMKAVIQRVTKASVSVNNHIVSSIGRGLCVLIGISRDDTQKDIEYIVRKILNLRLFAQGDARWKKSVQDENLEILCVSQFTLHSVLKGNKLDFHLSMAPEPSKKFYEEFLTKLKTTYKSDLVKDGIFGEYMQVEIQNDGPVTIQLDSQASSTS